MRSLRKRVLFVALSINALWSDRFQFNRLMISSQSIITKFGGERTTGRPIKFNRNPLLKLALTGAEYLQASCDKKNLPSGPRLYEECGTKVQRGELVDSSAEACRQAIHAAYAHVYGNAHLMDLSLIHI